MKRTTYEQVRRLTKGSIEKQIKDITKEMSIVQDQPTIQGEKRYLFKTEKCVYNP